MVSFEPLAAEVGVSEELGDDDDLPPLEPADCPDSGCPSTSFSHDNGLLHLSNALPGSKTPGRRQKKWEIRPIKLKELLLANPTIVIPIFQRPYCWSASLIESWFEDVIDPVHSFDRPHMLGKSCFQRKYNTPSSSLPELERDGDDDFEEDFQLICVDGQQRLTTTMLIIAAIRDAATNLLSSSSCDQAVVKRLISKADELLFNSTEEKDAWMRNKASQSSDALEIGTILPFSRLVPSYKDRRPFYQCILGRTDSAKDVIQGIAKTNFDRLVHEYVAPTDNNDKWAAILSQLDELLQGAVDSMEIIFERTCQSSLK